MSRVLLCFIVYFTVEKRKSNTSARSKSSSFGAISAIHRKNLPKSFSMISGSLVTNHSNFNYFELLSSSFSFSSKFHPIFSFSSSKEYVRFSFASGERLSYSSTFIRKYECENMILELFTLSYWEPKSSTKSQTSKEELYFQSQFRWYLLLQMNF
jgi:hypothetical protein